MTTGTGFELYFFARKKGSEDYNSLIQTCAPPLIQTLTKDLSQKDAFDHLEVGVGRFRQRVRGHWVVVQLQDSRETLSD